MTQEEYRGFVRSLHTHYQKEYPRESLNRVWPKIKDQPAMAMFNAVDRLMLENTNSMPPLQRIIDVVIQEGDKIRQNQIAKREDEAAAEKKQFERGQQKAFSENSDIAKKSIYLIQAMLSDKLTRGEYLEGIRHLDNLYPSAGFAAEGAKLRRFYDDSGLSLDGKPKTTSGIVEDGS